MSGVHRLEHIERFCAAAFADDDAVRAHAERVDDKVADRDASLSFDVRGARFETAEVFV